MHTSRNRDLIYVASGCSIHVDPGSHEADFGARHDSLLVLTCPIESLAIPMRQCQWETIRTFVTSVNEINER